MKYFLITLILTTSLVFLLLYLKKRYNRSRVKILVKEIKKASDMTKVTSQPFHVKTISYETQSKDASCTINDVLFEEYCEVIVTYANKTSKMFLVFIDNTEWRLMDDYGMSIPIDNKLKTIRRKVGS